MKKILKIIFVNLFIIFLIITAGEFISSFYFHTGCLEASERYSISYGLPFKKPGKKEYLSDFLKI